METYTTKEIISLAMLIIILSPIIITYLVIDYVKYLLNKKG